MRSSCLVATAADRCHRRALCVLIALLEEAHSARVSAPDLRWGRMMATVTDVGALIVETPGVCGGRPRIAGTGISVRGIAGWYKMGRRPEEVADRYGRLDLPNFRRR